MCENGRWLLGAPPVCVFCLSPASPSSYIVPMTRDRLRQRLLKDLQKNGGLLSIEGLHALDELDDIVLLETHRPDELGSNTYLFDTLEDVIWADRVQEIVPALVRAQVWLEKGLFIAGYIGYEAAPAFLPVPARAPLDGPTHLLWLGVYDTPLRVPRTGRTVPIPEPSDDLTMGELSPRIPRRRYLEALRRIRRYLEEGNTYQVNFTFGMDGRFTGSSVDLYARLRAAQPVPYGAYIRHGPTAVVSLSPELFVHVDGDAATLKPMKGTARRGRTTSEDREIVERLLASEKDRAENRMIVDLLRNDIGRLARPGSVKVPAFFSVERHPTLFQATSTITAQLQRRANLVDLFQALFPCGSVTGAPKIETMRIINELETEPRGVYTGAVGFLGPGGPASRSASQHAGWRGAFSVAIRTLVSDEDEGSFRLDIGSGVTIASEARSEYEECLLKARFVEMEPRAFRLFETILWTPEDGFDLLNDHLHRLADSADYFDWTFDIEAIRALLEEEHLRLHREVASIGRHRVRLTVGQDGSVEMEAKPLEPLPAHPKVGFSRKRISTDDRFQYHKTTQRPLYDTLLEKLRTRGWFDAIVLNERGEVAEGTRSNVVIRRGTAFLTPPLTSGILPGVYRQKLLRSRRSVAQETTLKPKDLLEADEVFVCNALRGMVRVEVVKKEI